MKKICRVLVFVLMILAWTARSIQASTPSPYELTTIIPVASLARDEAIKLIRQSKDIPEDSDQGGSLQVAVDQLESLGRQFDQVTGELAQVESALREGREEVESVIAGIYQACQQADPSFNDLDSEGQLAVVSQDPRLLEWQAYISSLEEDYKHLLAQQDQVKKDYDQQLLAYEDLALSLETYQDMLDQINLALLYAYSVPYYPPSQILIDSHSGDLANILTEVDYYLKHLVPYAYQTLSFEQIYQGFQRALDPEDLMTLQETKGSLYLDEGCFEDYAYIQELSLAHLDQIISLAQRDFYHTGDYGAYIDTYHKLLFLKESQYQYFFQINWEAFSELQAILVDILNAYNFTGEDHIRQVKQVQDKFSLRLVFFDEGSQTWYSAPLEESGFLLAGSPLLEALPEPVFFEEPDAYVEADSSEPASQTHYIQANSDPVTQQDRQKDQNKGVDSGIKPATSKEEADRERDQEADRNNLSTDSQESRLTYLKERLNRSKDFRKPQAKHIKKPDLNRTQASRNRAPSSKSSVTKPSQIPDKESKKPGAKQGKPESSQKDKGVKLPDTGEQRRFLWVSLGILLLGLLILAYQIYKKYQARKRRRDIPLD